MSDYEDDFIFIIDDEDDELKKERSNALLLILETFDENLSRSDENIQEYSPVLHGDLKIVNVELTESS